MKKILSGFAALVLALSAAGAYPAAEAEEEKKSNDILICGFENYNPDFTLMRTGGGFWKVERSTERVSGGKYSAKLTPGGYFENNRPFIKIPLTSAKNGFNYNVSEYSAMTAKVYNAENEVVPMKIGIETIKMGKCMSADYALEPGWNNVTYTFNHSLIQMYNGSLEDIPYMYFRFEPCVSRAMEDSVTVYLDDVKLVKLAGEIELVDIVTLDKYEICDFEKAYQQYIIDWWVYNDTPPETSIVDVRKGELPEGVVPSHGFRCLKVETHPRADDYPDYPHMIITDYVVKKAVEALTDEEKAKAYICFDLYSPDSNWGFNTGFRDSLNGASATLEISSTVFWSPTALKDKWTTGRFKLTDIDAREKVDFAENPEWIVLIWSPYFTGENRVFYLDNVRIEFDE